MCFDTIEDEACQRVVISQMKRVLFRRGKTLGNVEALSAKCIFSFKIDYANRDYLVIKEKLTVTSGYCHYGIHQFYMH